MASEPVPSPSEAVEPSEPSLRLKPAQLIELAPRLERYPTTPAPAWPDIVIAAAWLAGELGVSRTLWAEACRVMGRDLAAVTLALVSTRGPGHFTSRPGGYFAGMMRKLAPHRSSRPAGYETGGSLE